MQRIELVKCEVFSSVEKVNCARGAEKIITSNSHSAYLEKHLHQSRTVSHEKTTEVFHIGVVPP